MGEYKRGEHSSWDPDEEIRTWEKRVAVLAGGEDVSDEDEEEVALAVGSPEPNELDVAPEQFEPDAGVEAAVSEPAETVVSAEDLAKD